MTRANRQSGAALLMTLAVLLVVSTAGAALCLRVAETARSNVSERLSVASRLAAEAGIEKARAALLGDPRYTGESFAFEGFDVTVTATSAGDDVHVRSTAAFASVAATLRRSRDLPRIVAWRER